MKINWYQRNFKINDINNKNDDIDYYVEDDEEPRIPSIKRKNILEEIKEVQENFKQDKFHDKVRLMLKN